jgi:glutathione S-transferase
VRELFALPYSPWSEKARWALDHHRVEYTEHAYLPMLGEPLLRARTNTWRGKVSVPVLVDDGRAIFDSYAIARRAEELGLGTPLMPASSKSEIDGWNARSEDAIAAGRELVVAATLKSDDALRELVPAPLRGLGAASIATAKTGVSFIRRKYGLTGDEAASRDAMRAALVTLRHALSGDRSYVMDELSFADVAMAAALQMVKPVDQRFLAIGPATRAAWTDAELAGEFADLLAWRDRLYEAYRGRPRR